MNKNKQRVTAKAVHYCLKNLGNPVALKRSSLIQLPQVSEMAKSYKSSPWAQAYALRDLLKTTCANILAVEVEDRRQQRVLAFLRLFLGGSERLRHFTHYGDRPQESLPVHYARCFRPRCGGVG